MNIVRQYQIQYAMESSVNVALWKINNTDNDLIDTNSEGMMVHWEPISNCLTINCDQQHRTTHVDLQLYNDSATGHVVLQSALNIPFSK